MLKASEIQYLIQDDSNSERKRYAEIGQRYHARKQSRIAQTSQGHRGIPSDETEPVHQTELAGVPGRFQGR